MAELASESNQEAETSVREDEQVNLGKSEDYEDGDLSLGNTDFLAALNLVMVLLSLASLPSEEEDCKYRKVDKMEKALEKEKKDCRPTLHLHAKKREIHDARIPGKRAKQRFQPTIKDCRHGRKM